MDPSKQNYCKSSKIIIFGNISESNKLYLRRIISFDNSIIALLDSVKYFGITIGSGLKFNLHIKALESNIARSIGAISKLKQVLSASALRTLNYSLIYSLFLYGIVIWSSTFKTYLGKLSVLQNKALRIIAGGN